MKKLIFGALAALTLLASSCDKNTEKTETFFSQEATDSLIISVAQGYGTYWGSELTKAMAMDSTLTKEDFFRGVQYMMAADTCKAFLAGMNIGLKLNQMVSQYQAMGLNPNKTMLINELKASLMANTPEDKETFEKVNAAISYWNDSLNNAKAAYDIAILEASEESKANIANGEKYIADLKASNPAVKLTESGVAYEIIEQGTGDKVDPEKKACFNYTATTIDGRVIDKRDNQIVYISQRPVGFQEGVAMLNVGGKAKLYIPGKLAYGVKDNKRYGLGPNEMVIYEIEVVENPIQQPVQQSLNTVPGRPVRR